MTLPKDPAKVKEWKDKISKTLQGRRCCMATEYAKGHIPYNKGKKGLTKANSGSFRKGNRPANYMGGIKNCRKDGLYIRVGTKTYNYDNGKRKVGKYESLARYNYKKAFGEIPKNMIVYHKDGDMLNNEIDNLELISRSELLKRNHYEIEKICIVCGLEFKTKLKKTKTCSKDCNKEYRRLLTDQWLEDHPEAHSGYQKKYRDKLKAMKNTKRNI